MTVKENSGLRSRQKAKRRAAILSAARLLFERQGYDSTSMEQIADGAEVGVATVYNYFGTKGGLLSELLRPIFESFFERGNALIAAPGEDPVAGVDALLSIYLELVDAWESPGILTAFPGPGMSAEPVLDDLTREAETMARRQLETLLRGYQDRGLLMACMRADDAAFVLFATFNQHYLDAVVGKEAPGFDDERRSMLARQLGMVVGAFTSPAQAR